MTTTDVLTPKTQRYNLIVQVDSDTLAYLDAWRQLARGSQSRSLVAAELLSFMLALLLDDDTQTVLDRHRLGVSIARNVKTPINQTVA